MIMINTHFDFQNWPKMSDKINRTVMRSIDAWEMRPSLD